MRVSGRSRSRSPAAREHRVDNDPNIETIEVSEADAAFVLGRGGSTKRKLARVSGARLELHDSKSRGPSRLEISGDPEARARAKDYVKYVLTQRVGPVHIDPTMKRDDMSIVQVPENCVGFVMGKGGSVLRAMEDEWSTLMFFAKKDDGSLDSASTGINGHAAGNANSGGKKTHFGGEILAIFGTRRGRRGAELKVMSAVEHKTPGTFLTKDGDALISPLAQPGDDENDGFDYDLFPFRGDEFSYALGARGSTRKKLANASGAIIEYVSQTAVFAGYAPERKKARDYLTWLLKQKEHVAMNVDYADRDDVDVVTAPKSCMGYLTGYRGEGLRGIEQETRTFIFSNGGAPGGAPGAGDAMDDDDPGKKDGGDEANTKDGDETILIFGDLPADRKRAVKIVEERIEQAKRSDAGRGGGDLGGGGGARNGSGRDDRGRDGGRRDDRGGRDNRGRGRDDRGGRDDRRDDRRRDDRSRSPPRRDRRDDRRGRDDRRSRSPRRRDERDDRRRSRSPAGGDRDRRRGGGGGGNDVCFDFQKGKCARDRCKFKHESGTSGGGGGRDRSRDRNGGRDRGRRDRSRSFSRERR